MISCRKPYASQVLQDYSEEEYSRFIGAIETDYLHLYTAPSSLGGGVGLGVFARTSIAEGDILCEYRGG